MIRVAFMTACKDTTLSGHEFLPCGGDGHLITVHVGGLGCDCA